MMPNNLLLLLGKYYCRCWRRGYTSAYGPKREEATGGCKKLIN